MEMTNIHPGAIEEVYKCASINLSPNTMGQIALSVLVNPPKPGEQRGRQRGRGQVSCVLQHGPPRGGSFSASLVPRVVCASQARKLCVPIPCTISQAIPLTTSTPRRRPRSWCRCAAARTW